MVSCLFVSAFQLKPQDADALAGSKQKHVWLLSPSYLGWPCNRPRLYTILVRKDISLVGSGLGTIAELYRTPSLTAKDLLVAPQET